MRIVRNYRLTVVDEEGIIILELSLMDYDLSKSLAGVSVISDIREAIERDEIEKEKGG